ncbi:hypothetical protein [Streptomyces clavuligerus]|uniref:hypothetical protein n=1 Tax=Streptomyces clavuligerus TaxID=1901 RepID=UPI00020D93AC|nr:hypothetical protein [Streptomyces clavuligerus]WDN56046.1 hypothetical protein LL058_29650 [Streptomyces clavuligerus]
MTVTVAHVVVKRPCREPLVEFPRASELLLEHAVDRAYDPVSVTVTFDLDQEALRDLAAQYAGGTYLVARTDHVPAPPGTVIRPRDVRVFFLAPDSRLLCTATAEDNRQTVLAELAHITRAIENLDALRTSLLQRGHDLALSDRQLAGRTKLQVRDVPGLYSGPRPVHRLHGDALRALDAAGIPTDETVLVHRWTAGEIQDGQRVPPRDVPHVCIRVHMNGELRMWAGPAPAPGPARAAEELLRRAAQVLDATPGLTITPGEGTWYHYGATPVEQRMFLITSGH